MLDADLLLRRDFAEYGLTTPLLGNQFKFRKFLSDPVWFGIRFVDFIYCYNDRNIGGFGMIDSLARLRHNPVISGNHLDGIITRANVLQFLQTRAELGR